METHEMDSPAILAIDKVSFYMFMTGVYKDHRHWVQNYFYLTYFLLTVGLIIERQAINWLTNRNGCNYNKFQKFVELDLRKQAIDENWEIMVPKYNVDDYKNYYYRPDFRDIKMKIIETA